MQVGKIYTTHRDAIFEIKLTINSVESFEVADNIRFMEKKPQWPDNQNAIYPNRTITVK